MLESFSLLGLISHLELFPHLFTLSLGYISLCLSYLVASTFPFADFPEIPSLSITSQCWIYDFHGRADGNFLRQLQLSKGVLKELSSFIIIFPLPSFEC